MNKLQVAMVLETLNNDYEYKIFNCMNYEVVAIKQKRTVYPIWFTFELREYGCILAGIFLKIRNIIYSLDHNHHLQDVRIGTSNVNELIQHMTRIMRIQYYQFKPMIKKHLRSVKVLNRGETGILDYMLLPYKYRDKTFVCTYNLSSGTCSIDLYIEDDPGFKKIRGVKVKRPELNIEFYGKEFGEERFYLFQLFKAEIVKKLYEEVL
ncbi:MAG TPA: hypothetical protein VK190_02560 [Pseudoneobacillus sp.]|nr:hypothetical protein [Pseudoneobacillus sp.]